MEPKLININIDLLGNQLVPIKIVWFLEWILISFIKSFFNYVLYVIIKMKHITKNNNRQQIKNQVINKILFVTY